MIGEKQVIIVETATYIGDYKIEMVFNDKVKHIVDFFPFLSKSLNPLINKYLDKNEFSKFKIDEGDLEWNDYDLCFPIADLYENNVMPW